MKKSTLLLCTFVLGASMFALGQQSPSTAPPGSTPPTFPSDQSRPAPDTTAPVPQTAPDASVPSSKTSIQDSSAAGAQTISGCLSQASSGGGLTLTDSTGATFILQGDSSKLSKHVGEQVEVHGAVTPASASAGSSAAPSSAASTSGAADSSQSAGAGSSASSMVDVKSINKIASTCAPQQPAK